MGVVVQSVFGTAVGTRTAEPRMVRERGLRVDEVVLVIRVERKHRARPTQTQSVKTASVSCVVSVSPRLMKIIENHLKII